ncbi:MAG: tetratricopeptide repeat protein [Candidatus Omnitrophota bacterium]
MRARGAVCILACALFCCTPQVFFGLQWQTLHEQADKITLDEALVSSQHNPASFDSLYVLGLVYLNFYKTEDAEGIFKKILQLSPSSFEAQWGIAELLRRKHDLKESQAMLKNILKKAPGFPPALITLAYIRYTNKAYAESLALAEKVLAQGKGAVDTSNYTRALLIVAGSKGMLAHYGGPLAKVTHGLGVLTYLKKAQSLQPDTAGVLFGFGGFYLLAPTIVGGNNDKAVEYLEKAIQADPFFTDAYVRLAQAYKVRGDKEKYAFYLKKARQIDPQNELAIDIESGKCDFICVGK